MPYGINSCDRLQYFHIIGNNFNTPVFLVCTGFVRCGKFLGQVSNFNFHSIFSDTPNIMEIIFY